LILQLHYGASGEKGERKKGQSCEQEEEEISTIKGGAKKGDSKGRKEVEGILSS